MCRNERMEVEVRGYYKKKKKKKKKKKEKERMENSQSLGVARKLSPSESCCLGSQPGPGFAL